jgi:hypothetical protein
MSEVEQQGTGNFTVVLEDENLTEVGGAATLADAVVLAAAIFTAGGGGNACKVMGLTGDVQAWVGRAGH